MNIFFRELKANLKSLLIWSGITVLFVVVGFSKFSAFYENPELSAIIDSLPPAVLSALNLNAFNMTTITGFFGIMFTYLALIVSISAVMWGSDIISKEERDRTVEFALTLPITRQKLVTAKTLAALVNCILLLLVTWGITVAMAPAYNPDDAFYSFLSLGILALFILQLVFLAVGIFLGCAMKQYKRASSAAVFLLLGTYILSILAALSNKLGFLKYFSPFSYFNPAVLMRESRIDILFVFLSAGIIVVSLVGAYVSYAKRDLYI